jgi:hypothetical protein
MAMRMESVQGSGFRVQGSGFSRYGFMLSRYALQNKSRFAAWLPEIAGISGNDLALNASLRYNGLRVTGYG